MPAKKTSSKKIAKKAVKKTAAKKSAASKTAKKKTAKKAAKKKPVKKTAGSVAKKLMPQAAPAPSSSSLPHAKVEPPPQAPLGDPHADTRPLPEQYGHTRLTVLARDPEWLFAYWEITEEDARRYGIEGNGQAGPKVALRVYDVTGVRFTGENAHSFFDVPVTGYAKSWYLHVGVPGRAWSIDLGTLAPDGEFTVIARSNSVETPRDGVSDETDEQWMEVDEERFETIFRLSGGETVPETGASEGIGRRVTRRLLPQYLVGASEQFAAASDLLASEAAARIPKSETETE